MNEKRRSIEIWVAKAAKAYATYESTLGDRHEADDSYRTARKDEPRRFGAGHEVAWGAC